MGKWGGWVGAAWKFRGSVGVVVDGVGAVRAQGELGRGWGPGAVRVEGLGRGWSGDKEQGGLMGCGF